MDSFVTFLVLSWKPAFFVLLAAASGGAMIAVASPRLFERVVTIADRPINVEPWLSVLNRSISVDRPFVRHARLLGIATLASVVLLLTMIWRLS